MADLNNVTLDGTIVDEPELRFTPGRDGGAPVPSLHFTIAVNRPVSKYNNAKQKTDYIHVVQWGEKAKATHAGIRKKARIALVGYLQSRNYDRKEEVSDDCYQMLIESLERLGLANLEEGAAEVLGALGLDGNTVTSHTAYEVCANNIEFREGCGSQAASAESATEQEAPAA